MSPVLPPEPRRRRHVCTLPDLGLGREESAPFAVGSTCDCPDCGRVWVLGYVIGSFGDSVEWQRASRRTARQHRVRLAACKGRGGA